jgi:hypothetical protein
MPDAVRDRPPRNGPTNRYFMPLNCGSSLSVSVEEVFCVTVVDLAGFLSASVRFCGKLGLATSRKRAPAINEVRPTVTVTKLIQFTPGKNIDIQFTAWTHPAKGFPTKLR